MDIRQSGDRLGDQRTRGLGIVEKRERGGERERGREEAQDERRRQNTGITSFADYKRLFHQLIISREKAMCYHRGTLNCWNGNAALVNGEWHLGSPLREGIGWRDHWQEGKGLTGAGWQAVSRSAKATLGRAGDPGGTACCSGFQESTKSERPVRGRACGAREEISRKLTVVSQRR